MAITYKILGQAAPTATTNTDLYTVPAATQTIVNTIAICNRDTASGTYRIAVRPAGAALANKHYVAYDVVIGANDTIKPDINLSLGVGDVITVYVSSANFSITVSGCELT